MKIVMMGLGYIGLPTAVLLSERGHQIHGVDINEVAVDQLNKGRLTIEEPNLEQGFLKALISKSLTISTTPTLGDVFMIAVPTPNKKNKLLSCDVSYLIAAINSIIPYIRKGNSVIIESTIAPRTMSTIVAPLLEKTGLSIGKELFVAHCPERVLPGNMMMELKQNTRIIGGMTNECSKKIKELYKTFVEGEIVQTSAEVAELTKLMENTYRDVNIALANELVKVGTELEINALEVINLANKHPRVSIHSPGPGVGGHCLAVDPYFISSTVPEKTPLIQQARKINSKMPETIVEMVNSLMKTAPNNKITILGLAYKGNIDDIRESPAIDIVERLKNEGYELCLYDQHVEVSLENKVDNIVSATKDSSLLLILTDHSEYKNISEMTKNMSRELIFDTKNIVNKFGKTATYLNLGNVFSFDK
ncbi:nucleotide sugar dehydrogenase [Carnobacterium maltaromaticum]|uniref:Nucleotide sugar dehydrogenase n=1 Tax=Carnobacterium maltaromaticum TaxID=2751 RepID=A0AAW9JRA9_CARML|nr:nucleotide sugar dehydrogenase [Carnobacterium maltaromaticum]MDZ5759260.1 nucleotide sugar dehydrogenase [Carnobacterium maltaromaticum]